MLSEEARLKLDDMRQAIALERRHRFINVNGRRMPFARFMETSLKELTRWVLLDDATDDHARLLQRFQRYGDMDVAHRMQTLDSVEHWMRELLAPLRPTPPSASIQSAATAPPSLAGDASQTRSNPPEQTDVQYVKGVGPRLAAQLKLMGLATVGQLLRHYPRQYVDYNQQVPIAQLMEGQQVSIVAKVVGVSHFEAKNRPMSIVRLTVRDASGTATASWFFTKTMQAQLHAFKNRFERGMEVLLSGKVKWDSYSRCPAMDRPEVQFLSYGEEELADTGFEASLHAGRIVPVYSLTQGVNLKALRRAIYNALDAYADAMVDPLPASVRTAHRWMPLAKALQAIHFPASTDDAEAARQRLVFEEFFLLQCRLALTRLQFKQSAPGLVLTCRQEGSLVAAFLRGLPFELTGAQQRVFDEICSDLARPEPMNRLLHGDVGSGKTVVAALTLLVGLENGYQGALMAPTEILAEQHYRKFVDWLTPLGLRVGLVVGKANARQRREIQQGLLNGQIHIAVGTHALIQDDVEFQNLGVVVVDEQHRFGVRQRMLLRSKGTMPEQLTMTATPIPRTMALTLHGDMDISQLDELPRGRQPIRTVLMGTNHQQECYDLIRQQVRAGRQAYIVFPLIDESESLAAKAATTEAERLQKEVFPDLSVGLLHGKMRSEEKDAAMAAFASGQTQILVSTTVVEVGVDVPNATVMVIENADRFGLAQLHQLRGRVGRGAHASTCVLVASKLNPETRERLQVLVDSTNGFDIAEKDLALRGPGDYLGTRQSGLPDLLLGDLVEDKTLLEKARDAAFALLADDPQLLHYPETRQALFRQQEDAAQWLGAG